MNIKKVAKAGIIAALYTTFTLIFLPISFGPFQLRVSEAFCVLPVFFVEAIPGLTIGCLLANIIGGNAIYDVIFGTLATLLGAIGTYALRSKKSIAWLPPVISNTLIIPFVLRYAYGTEELLYILFGSIFIGEMLAVGVLGNLLIKVLEKQRKLFN